MSTLNRRLDRSDLLDLEDGDLLRLLAIKTDCSGDVTVALAELLILLTDA